MFLSFFILQAQIPIPSPTIDLGKLVDSFGWKVGVFVAVVYTLLQVVRQRSQINTNRAQGEIDAAKRDDDFRAAQEAAMNEIRAKHEKLMDETRLQMKDERNEAQKRLMEMMDNMQKLSNQFIEAQHQTIKLQNELNSAREAEKQALKKAEELQNQVNSLSGEMKRMRHELGEASARIDVLVREKNALELRVQRISTGSNQQVTLPTEGN